MEQRNRINELIHPPAEASQIQRGIWVNLPETDPMAIYLTTHLWPQTTPPQGWELARLSRAVYIYREISTHWTIVVKFYTVKTGNEAERWSKHEYDCIEQAQAAGLVGNDMRVVRPIGVEKGVLFLEYVEGLTLEYIIALRGIQPGRLVPCLERVAKFLGTLHTHGPKTETQINLADSVRYARKIVDELIQLGLLQNNPLISEGILGLIDEWANLPIMSDFKPVLTHGDATIANFIFSKNDSLVVMDWEFLQMNDPAADLGYLMTEILYSIRQYRGNTADAIPFVQHFADAYCQTLPSSEYSQAILERTRFYRALTTLRIARNEWVSPFERMTLVAQAMALLSR